MGSTLAEVSRMTTVAKLSCVKSPKLYSLLLLATSITSNVSRPSVVSSATIGMLSIPVAPGAIVTVVGREKSSGSVALFVSTDLTPELEIARKVTQE